MKSGSPAQLDSQSGSQPEAAPASEVVVPVLVLVFAPAVVITVHALSDASPQTVPSLLELRTDAAWSHVAARPIGQRSFEQRHARNMEPPVK
jgi:hypothetical protein